MNQSEIHLICDLDGTLLKNDFFLEALSKMIIENPLKMLKLFTTDLKDLKKMLLKDSFDAVQVDEVLNKEVHDYILTAGPQYHSVHLISASPQEFVQDIGQYLGGFDSIAGSTTSNLKSENKLAYIREKGLEPFVYIGDSKDDKVLFNESVWYYKVEKNHMNKFENRHS